MIETEDADVHVALLRLILATIDNNDEAAHDAICSVNAVALVHHAVHQFNRSISPESRDAWRRDIIFQLEDPAGWDDYVRRTRAEEDW